MKNARSKKTMRRAIKARPSELLFVMTHMFAATQFLAEESLIDGMEIACHMLGAREHNSHWPRQLWGGPAVECSNYEVCVPFDVGAWDT